MVSTCMQGERQPRLHLSLLVLAQPEPAERGAQAELGERVDQQLVQVGW